MTCISSPAMRAPLLRRADDGLDRPALPVLPPAADAARADLHRDDHHRARSSTAIARGCSATIRRSIRSRSSSAAAIRARWRDCARIGADLGYDEINLNVGCPSDRVQEGRFGACLMAEPALVGDCVAAMKAAVAIPVTVKCRIGIDEQDPEAVARRIRRRGRGGRRRRADRACAQGLAEGPVAAREPRRAAARLRPRVPPEGRASASCRSCSTAASRASSRRHRSSAASTA